MDIVNIFKVMHKLCTSYAQNVDNSCITSDFDVQKIKNPDLIRKYAGIA